MFFGGDPFEHFAQSAGGGRRPGGARAANVDTTKLYETLGVSCFVAFQKRIHLLLFEVKEGISFFAP